jgi:vancomycin resistance protein VanJ
VNITLKTLSLKSQSASIGYGIGTLIYLSLRLLVGNDWNLVALVSNVLPWLALIGLLGFVILLLHRRWKFAILHVPVLIAFFVIYGDRFDAPEPPPVPAGSLEITAATYNVASIFSDVDKIVAVIDTLDADVIGLQELGESHAAVFEQELSEAYPYQVLYPVSSEYGLGLLSRYPVLNSEIITTYENDRGDLRIGLIRVEIEVEGSPVAIYVAHPPVPLPFSTNSGLVLYDESVRDDQLQTIRAHVEAETMPVLVLCDCNTTDQSNGYQVLAGILTDSFLEAGRGLGFSYAPQPLSIPPVLPLLWRIDYIWHNEGFVATQAVVNKKAGTSDHRPVVAELWLKP